MDSNVNVQEDIQNKNLCENYFDSEKLLLGGGGERSRKTGQRSWKLDIAKVLRIRSPAPQPLGHDSLMIENGRDKTEVH